MSKTTTSIQEPTSPKRTASVQSITQRFKETAGRKKKEGANTASTLDAFIQIMRGMEHVPYFTLEEVLRQARLYELDPLEVSELFQKYTELMEGYSKLFLVQGAYDSGVYQWC